MSGPLISHAVLLDDEEARRLLGAEVDRVVRDGPTALRMRVGLARADGSIVATAELTGVDEVAGGEDGPAANAWVFGDVEPLERPVALPPGGGPLWRRMSGAERLLLSNDRPVDHFPGAVEPAPREGAPREVPSAARDLSTADPTAVDLVGRTGPEGREAGPIEGALIAADGIGRRVSEGGGEFLGDGDAADASDQGSTRRADAGEGAIGGDVLVVDDPDATPGLPVGLPEAELLSEAAATDRAFAFVPVDMIDVDEAFRLLVRLRDTEIKRTFPDVRPEHGILRRTVLQAMLDSGVASMEEYEEFVPADMRNLTDRGQVRTYLKPIVDILARVR